MINPAYVNSADALRMIGDGGIFKRMIAAKKIKPHRFTKENWYERGPIVEMKKIIDSTMIMEEIKDLINCSHRYIDCRVKAGEIREVKNDLFGKNRRYLKEDVFKFIEKSKNKHKG